MTGKAYWLLSSQPAPQLEGTKLGGTMLTQAIDKAWEQQSKLVLEWTGYSEDVAEDFFRAGFIAGMNFQDEQLAMDRDYQEELNQQEALRRGDG